MVLYPLVLSAFHYCSLLLEVFIIPWLGFSIGYFDYFLWCYLFEGVERFSCKVIDGLIECSAVENLFVIEIFFKNIVDIVY